MILRTDNLVKIYGSRTVVNHVSINLTQGEIVGLLGPNGAGKTTTFYMTAGLVTPNEGEIFLDDMNITKFPVYKRAQHGIGYLAQEASVFRKLTVEDNIRAVLQMTKLTKEEHRDKPETPISELHSLLSRVDSISSGFSASLSAMPLPRFIRSGITVRFILSARAPVPHARNNSRKMSGASSG